MSLKKMAEPNMGHSPASQAHWGSVMCPRCQKGILSSIVFNAAMNVRCHFQLDLFKPWKKNTAFSSLSFTRSEQDAVKHKDTVECPHCEKFFWLCIDFESTYSPQEYKVNLSITTQKDENQGSQSSWKGWPGITFMPIPKRVKVFYMCTGQTFGADNEVKEQLVERNLPFTRVEETSLEDCYVIVLFCPITSRVGSDVESCMANTTVSMSGKPVILVLMHHTRDDDYSTAGISWSEVYENVMLDVHLFFHETKPGLLACRQNDEAFSIITNELKKCSKLFG
ncbi:uncharacterized protein LOC110367804 isoform X1 [Fundulus heteroclitus]|uniref:uncharacterized protein LOC110367804 isoform X1 n=1 Tax=Fundulus heteroclitus TaxID=8078 RepID=UPI00165A29D8|nr:uncharacterized protein LOC110367804 isoform X1 [Fundulus heteroclitus]XP_035990923.1 uncharacterized protein LOC110367804 isoform X1 [Fundulus heteroclitus]